MLRALENKFRSTQVQLTRQANPTGNLNKNAPALFNQDANHTTTKLSKSDASRRPSREEPRLGCPEDRGGNRSEKRTHGKRVPHDFGLQPQRHALESLPNRQGAEYTPTKRSLSKGNSKTFSVFVSATRRISFAHQLRERVRAEMPRSSRSRGRSQGPTSRNSTFYDRQPQKVLCSLTPGFSVSGDFGRATGGT